MNSLANGDDGPVPPFGQLPLDGVVATYRSELDRTLGLDPARRTSTGTSVTTSGLLTGTGLVVVARAERHRVVSCDPAVVGSLDDLAGPVSADPDELVATIRDRGGVEVGTWVDHVVHRRGLRDLGAPDDGTFDTRPDDGAATTALDELVTAGAAEDVTAAGFERPADRSWLTIGCDRTGEVVVAAQLRAASWTPSFGEVGVLLRPSARGTEWAAAAASLAARRAFATGRLPLMRCDDLDSGALQLAARLGFRRVTELWASRFPALRPPSTRGW
ncbi:MAG: hypothetical protein AAGA17_01950 [Actinomycetota bacterium]